MTEKIKGFVVSHFHHDPAWIKDFQESKIVLANNIDRLLEILDANQEFKYFTIESVFLLDDYFKIRPENKEKVLDYVRSGRILVHPVAVLMDWYLSRGRGEALIRNLLLAKKKAKEWKVPLTDIFYSPDSFGHNPILIPILNEFGISSMVFFRGMGEEAAILNTEFYWQDQNDKNSRLLAVWLMLAYTSGFNLPKDKEKLRERLDLAKKLFRPKISLPVILLMNGQDFAPPQQDIVDVIKVANQEFKDIELIHSNLPEYVKEIKRMSPKLRSFEGELRGSHYWWIHPGTLSSRMYLKQENQKSQILLERQTEPLLSFAWTLGANYESAFLNLAWKYILENLHHDGITGSHPDRASDDIMAKFRGSEHICQELLNKSLAFISEKINTQKREGIAVVVYNSEGRERVDFVRAKIKLPEHLLGKQLIAEDCNGKRFPCQIYSQKELQERDYEFNASKVVYTDISFVAEVPSCGYKTFWIRENDSTDSSPSTLKVGNNYLENKYFRVEVDQNGSLDIFDRTTGRVLKNQNIFEDGGDIGDVYNYSPPINDKIVGSGKNKVKITLADRGPVSVALKIESFLNLPKSTTKNRKSRSSRMVKCPVVCYVSLYQDIPMVLIRVSFNNKVEDHRLRVLFPVELKTDYSFAENYFGVVKRPLELPPQRKDVSDKDMEEYFEKLYQIGGPLPAGREPGWVEDSLGTHPQGSFVDINDGNYGLAIANKGLPEYEVLLGKGEKIIALTLLRAIPKMFQNNLINRRGFMVDDLPHLELFPKEPKFQCPGEYTFEYAIIPHQGDWRESKVYQQAHQFENSLISWQEQRHFGKLPSEKSFVSIEPDTLIISAIKKAEEDNSLIVRFYNISDRKVDGRLRFYKKLRQAFRCNMKEENLEELPIGHDRQEVKLKVGEKKIITLELHF